MRDFMRVKNRGTADSLAKKMMNAFKTDMQQNRSVRCAVLLVVCDNQQTGVGVASRHSDVAEMHGETMMVLTEALLDFALASTEPIGTCLRISAVFSEETGRLLGAKAGQVDG